MNAVWESYKNLYYGNEAVSSVYLSERKDQLGPFQGSFCIQKKCPSGSWNSLHIVRVDQPMEAECVYHAESYIVLIVQPDNLGEQNPTSCTITTSMDIGASLSKQTTVTSKIQNLFINSSHIENIGALIEDNEIVMRSNLEQVYLPKHEEIMDKILKPKRSMHMAPNPLMAMMMDSDILKKKLAARGDA